jgi:hypothetical protein
VPDSEEVSTEELAEAKRRTRINALVMFLFFFVSAVLPQRWKLLSPLVLLIPLIYRAVARLRSGSDSSSASAENLSQIPASPVEEPYSHTPRDPKDPRRYKPIG